MINNVSGLIGKTPLIRLVNIEKHFRLKAEIYAKLEMYNPSGSVKDRAAYFMLKDAFEKGNICEGDTIVEPTSGNMGISLSMLSAAFGLKSVILMPENMSEERIRLIRAYGGRVILTPGNEGMSGAIKRAEEYCCCEKNTYTLSQFRNPQNLRAHYFTTAPEIYDAMNGDIDAFVAGVGTGGTIGGVGQYFKNKTPSARIVAVEPSCSAVLSGEQGGAHKIQGIGAGFMPPLLDMSLIDRIMGIDDSDAFEYAEKLSKIEGIFAGISSGAALCASINLALTDEYEGKKIVTLFSDGGKKYLSVFG